MKCRNRTPCERCGGTDAVVVHRFRGSTVSERCLSCSDGTQECGAEMEVCPDCEPMLNGRRGCGFHDFVTPDGVEHTPTCRSCSGTGYVCPRCRGARKETAHG